jgi:hypothetical protein
LNSFKLFEFSSEILPFSGKNFPFANKTSPSSDEIVFLFPDSLQYLMASGSDSDGGHASAAPALIPHENWFKTLVLASHEDRLCRSYSIPDSVSLHFQELDELFIVGGDVSIHERKLIAGFPFPFPAIA